MARFTFITLSSPAPTPVTTISNVVVRIIFTEMLGPPLAMLAENIPAPQGLLPFVRDGDSCTCASAVPGRVQTGIERDRRQLFHRRHRPPDRRFQPRVLCAPAPQRRPRPEGEALLRGAR